MTKYDWEYQFERFMGIGPQIYSVTDDTITMLISGQKFVRPESDLQTLNILKQEIANKTYSRNDYSRSKLGLSFATSISSCLNTLFKPIL